jgi:aspartate aminotransferase
VSSPSLSSRTSLLRPSPTIGISAKAAALKAQGVDVLAFGAGEPDFATPVAVCEAAKDAIDKGYTKYVASAGIADLRLAISEKLARENQLDYAPDQIVVSTGAKHSLYNALQILVEPGDEVILIAPYWMTYADQIRLAGGIPKVIHTTHETGFIPSPAELVAAVSPRTKAIMLNSPANPTGAVLPEETLRLIAELADRHNFWIVADEIYERLVYGVKHRSIASLDPALLERTITVGGCAKSYAMTGWRIGFAAAPPAVAKAMSNLQDQVTSNNVTFAQYGAAVAFRLPWDVVEAMRAQFEARRDVIVDLLRAIPGVEIATPQGAFYAFAQISNLLKPGEDDVEFAARLLDEARIAVVPGSVFEGPGYIRMSYATDLDTIRKGVERLGNLVAASPA